MLSEQVEKAFKEIQTLIISGLEHADGKGKFIRDEWERPGGGGGITRVLERGEIFEKAGVNFSSVHGKLSDDVLRVLNTKGEEFFATGVSLVIHPSNPFVPIIHMNIRYFEIDGGVQAWFGGGIDLTPIYIDISEAAKFHGGLKAIMDKYDASYYDRFKQWADEYFYLPHRNETRGIGGVFFDRMGADGINLNKFFSLCCDLGNSFCEQYLPIVEANKNKSYSEKNIFWQSLRRSRYAEFNLAYDRGTRFGLESHGRTESILMSLPPIARWVYNYTAEQGSDEEKTLSFLKKEINWIDWLK